MKPSSVDYPVSRSTMGMTYSEVTRMVANELEPRGSTRGRIGFDSPSFRFCNVDEMAIIPSFQVGF